MRSTFSWWCSSSSDIAGDFGADVKSVTYAVFLTLAMRPVGAFLFGRLADHFGRRPALMASVLLYSAMEFASAFAPSLRVFLVLRALYGIAMGGEWGVGASLAFESIPVRSRGLVSGMLQAGYPCGYLLASIVFGLLFDHIGWRGMFIVGAAAGAAGAVYPQQGAGVRGLDGGPQRSRRPRACGGARGALAAGAVCDCTDDLLQLLQPRHAGSVSALPRGAARLFHRHGVDHRHRLQHRRHRRRHLFGTLSSRIGRRRAIAHCRGAGAGGAAVLGLRPDAAGAGAGGVCDAVHGAGRLGCGAGASQ